MAWGVLLPLPAPDSWGATPSKFAPLTSVRGGASLPPSAHIHPWSSGAASSTARRFHAPSFEYTAASLPSPGRAHRPDPPSCDQPDRQPAGHSARRPPPAHRAVWTVAAAAASTSASSSATVSGLSSGDQCPHSTPIVSDAEALGGGDPVPMQQPSAAPPPPSLPGVRSAPPRPQHAVPSAPQLLPAPAQAAAAAGTAAGGDPLIGASVPATTAAAQAETQQQPHLSDASVDLSFHTAVQPSKLTESNYPASAAGDGSAAATLL